MNLKKIYFICVLSLFSGSVCAGGYTGSSDIQWMSSVIGDGEARYFAVKGNWNTPDACSKSSEKIWIVKDPDSDVDNVNSMYSMAMGAYIANKPIEMYQEGCENNRPKAKSVYLGER